MNAYVLSKNGGIDNLVLKDVAIPSIKDGEVLVKVKAIGINRVDAFVRQNPDALRLFINPVNGEDIILGWDISGVVVETGTAVKNIKVNDEVFGLINFFGHGKAYAQYVVAGEEHLALKPANVSHEQSAAAGLAALTAWQALVTYGKIERGEIVLIHGASGGVGHFALQIAKHFGARVIATASSENKDFVLSLGADEFIDYENEAFEDRAADPDLVLDSLPGDHVLRSLSVVKTGGRVISLLPYADPEGRMAQLVSAKNLSTHRLVVRSNGEDVRTIARLMKQNAIGVHVSKVYEFSDLPLSHLQIETGKTRGKVVVSLNE